MTRIAFVGMGAMGAPMAANLLKAGFPVTVHNRTREREEPLAAMGASRAASPAEAAAGAEIIFTCVSDVPDVKQVICGTGGVLEGAPKGALVIDTSTIGPAAAREIAQECAARGVRFLDAPVSGGVGGAQAGTLSIMVGGDARDFQEAMPALQAMGRSVAHFGPVGAGQAAKLVNQIIGAGALAAVAEGLVAAGCFGLDRDQVVQAVSQGAAGSWMLENLGPKMNSGELSGGFRVALQQKDLRLVIQAAEESGMSLALTRLVSQFFAAAEAKGHSDDGTQSIVTAFEELVQSRPA